MKIIKKLDCCFNEDMELVCLDGSKIEGPYMVVGDDFYEELLSLASKNSREDPKKIKTP